MSDLSAYSKPAFSPTKVDKLKFFKDHIIVSDMKFDQRVTSGGIILMDDDKKSSGIRPRWAKIYGLGPEQDDPQLEIGKWILISHGRWTRGITVETPLGKQTLRKVDPGDILLVSDEPMEDETMSDKVY
jgi:co-chaperonin GroES (HSP10)